MWFFLPLSLFQVRFSHVLLGDALTSLSNVLVDSISIMCAMTYAVTGTASCESRTAGALLQTLPFLLRAWQCYITYRLGDKREQIINLAKYLSVLPVIVLSWMKHSSAFVGDGLEERDAVLVDWWVVAVAVSTAFSLSWDVFMDWGLGAPVLRTPLLLGPPALYYAVGFVNMALRLSWSLRLSAHLHMHASASATTILLELLEIVRRFLWNFLRVEWEIIKEGHVVEIDRPLSRQRSWDAAQHGHPP